MQDVGQPFTSCEVTDLLHTALFFEPPGERFNSQCLHHMHHCRKTLTEVQRCFMKQT